MAMMTRDKKREDLKRLLSELRESLRRLTPSTSMLEAALKRIPGSEALTPKEKLGVLRGLERVWHIMRILHLLSEYFWDKMIFGGGTILNYIYMVRAGEPPRLTFDLDGSWYRRVRSKRVILQELVGFNQWLHETGNTLSIPVSSTGRRVELYMVEYDVEKDYFPTLLSLRVPVITRYDGRPFYEFLEISEYNVIVELRRIFEEVLGVRNARIDYIRVDISLEPPGPGVERTLRNVFGSTHRVVITPIEHQLAYKIAYKLGKDFGEDLKYNIHDILKALLDLRLLEYVDIDLVVEALDNIVETSIPSHIVDSNLEAVLSMGKRIWEHNYHYTLIRKKYTLNEIVERVKRRLQIKR